MDTSKTTYLRFERVTEVTHWSIRAAFVAIYLRAMRDSDVPNMEDLVIHEIDGERWVETTFGMRVEAEVCDANYDGGDAAEWRVEVSQSSYSTKSPSDQLVRVQLLLMAASWAEDWEQRIESGEVPRVGARREFTHERVEVGPIMGYNFSDPRVTL